MENATIIGISIIGIVTITIMIGIYLINNPSFDYSVCNNLINASTGTIKQCGLQ